jgi:hypothetical protein
MITSWYYSFDGKQYGPVPDSMLKQLASTGKLHPSDLVWKEGMPEWRPARTVPGLFTESPPDPRRRPVEEEPAPAPRREREEDLDRPSRRREREEDLDRPSRRREREEDLDRPARRREREDDYDDYEEDQDRPRRRRPSRGMSPTAKLLIGLGIALAVIVVIVVVIIVLVNAFKTRNPTTFDIRAGEEKTFHIQFKQGVRAEIRIISEKNTDIDMWVYDDRGMQVAEDTRFDKDCYVTWIPDRTQTYKIKVANINRDGKLPVGNNRCTMSWNPKE